MADYPKTIQLLLTLSPKERLKFKEYLTSPYFNKIVTLPQLFKNIIQLYNEKKGIYNEAELTKLTYDSFNLRKYKFDLQKLKEHFEQFTAIQVLQNHALKKAVCILEDYLFRHNGLFFELKYQQTKKLFNAHPKDVNYFQFLYEMESLKDTYINLYKDKRTGDTNLQEVSNAIDKDFLAKKLCYVVLMLNRQNITQVHYDFGFKDYVLNYLNEQQVIDEAIINLFYWAYQILAKTNRKEAFEKLNKQLLNNNHNISNDIINALYAILHNNTKPVFKDRVESNKQYFNLYDVLLKQNYIQIKDKISTNFFKNVVSVCIELDEYEYLDKFMEQYEHKLYPEELAHDAFAFNKARLLLYKGELKRSNEMQVNLHFKDSRYKLDMKRIEIMLNYELEEFLLLESLVTSFQVALTPNRIKHLSEKKIEANRNFINHFNKLYRFSNSPNKTNDDIKQFIETIENAQNITDQKWLIKKAEVFL